MRFVRCVTALGVVGFWLAAACGGTTSTKTAASSGVTTSGSAASGTGGASGSAGAGGATVATSGTSGPTAASGTSASATSGASASATSGTSASASSGTSASASSGGGTCAVNSQACGGCIGTQCKQQIDACSLDVGCAADIGANNMASQCVCAAQQKNDSAGVQKCAADFKSKGALWKAVGDCVTTSCKTECGF